MRPGGGTVTVYEAPSGPGVRTDGFGYAGYRTSGAFDSLLAKVIVQAPDFAGAVARSSRALSEFRLEGVATNIPFLRNILAHADFVAGNVHTRWVDENMAALVADGPGSAAPLRGGGAACGQRWRVRRRPGQESRSPRAVRA